MATFDSAHAIEILKQKCDADLDFAQLLTRSLRKAYLSAQTHLTESNLDSFCWPRNIEDYLIYLNDFSQWAPRFCGRVAIQQPDKAQLQDVYHRLFHFYWLIDQYIDKDQQQIFQELPWFSNWLAEYEDLWELFLNHAEHLNHEILELLITDSPKTLVKKHQQCTDMQWLAFNWQPNSIIDDNLATN